ncbi:glycosyltransferase [Patescibacteria group bacterium]|nr:glycosyltransferase [Patescibacteria group bacterium]
MFLSVIIPCYNEEATVGTVVQELLDAKFEFDMEIIVVNDASTDSSGEILNEFFLGGKILLLHNSQNLGKTKSIKKALQYAQGEFILIKDADLEYSTSDIPKLVALAEATGAKAVYGSRSLAISGQKSLFHYGNQFITKVFNLVFRVSLTDLTTCYKLIYSGFFKDNSIESGSFGFCPEVTAKLVMQGVDILEEPIQYNPRSYENGKKLKVWEGVYFLYLILRFRLQGLLRKYTFKYTLRNLFEFLAFLGFFLSSMWYLASRNKYVPNYSIQLFIMLCIVFLFLLYNNKFNRFFSSKISLFSILLFVFVWLFLSVVSSREFSYDGLFIYLKRTLYISKYGFLPPTTVSVPYLAELVFGLLHRMGSFPLLQLFFGLLGLSFLFITLKVYEALGVSSENKKLSLFILLTTPSTLALFFVEFKVELFLFNLVALSLYFLIKGLKTFERKHLLLFGLFLGLAVLTKFVFIVPAVLLIFFAFFVSKDPRYIYESGFLMSLIILLWIVFFGLEITWLGMRIPSYLGFIDTPGLEMNPVIEHLCKQDWISRDKGTLFYTTNLLQRIFQPLYYFDLSVPMVPNDTLAGLLDYGVFLYLSFWIFIPVSFPLLFSSDTSPPLRVLILASIFFLLFFFFEIGTIYWYLYGLLPIYILSIPFFLNRLRSPFYRKAVYSMILSLGFIHLFVVFQVLLGISGVSISTKELRDSLGVWEISDQVNALDPEDKILMPFQFPYSIRIYARENHQSYNPVAYSLAFVDPYYTRVVDGSCYFISSGKNFPEMLQEFENLGIKYISVHKESLLHSWHGDAYLRAHNENLYKFITLYTHPVIEFADTGVIYEIDYVSN